MFYFNVIKNPANNTHNKFCVEIILQNSLYLLKNDFYSQKTTNENPLEILFNLSTSSKLSSIVKMKIRKIEQEHYVVNVIQNGKEFSLRLILFVNKSINNKNNISIP